MLAVQVCTDKLFKAIDCTSRHIFAAEESALQEDRRQGELEGDSSDQASEEDEFEAMRRLHRGGGSWCNPKHNVAYGQLHYAPTHTCTSSEN